MTVPDRAAPLLRSEIDPSPTQAGRDDEQIRDRDDAQHDQNDRDHDRDMPQDGGADRAYDDAEDREHEPQSQRTVRALDRAPSTARLPSKWHLNNITRTSYLRLVIRM